MNKRKYDGGKSPREKSKWDILEGIIGKKKAKIVRRKLGGDNTYIPKEDEGDTIKDRNDKIYEKFLNGKSYEELARDYKMTVKWIREILKGYEKAGNKGNDYKDDDIDNDEGYSNQVHEQETISGFLFLCYKKDKKLTLYNKF